MSRFRTFALLAALAALATVFAACGGSSDKSSESPQSVLDSATLEGVDSATLDLSLNVDSEGKEGGDIDVSLSGPFESGSGTESLPQLDMDATAKGTVEGEDVDFDGGLTLLTDRAYVDYEGTEYEVDPTTFGFVKSGFEKATNEQGAESGDTSACEEAATGFKVGDFVDNLSNDGSADVDGTTTTKVSGDLDVGSAIDAVIELTEDSACSAQLEAAGPLPLSELEEAKSELSSSVKKAHIDVYVGDDDIIRKVAAEVTVEPQDSSSEKVEVAFEMSLSGVNDEIEITAPDNAKPLEGLFQKLGVNPVELLEAGSDPSAGIGSLLEGLGGDSPSTGGGSSSGGSGGGSGDAGQQAYLQCLQGAETPADLQKCASQLQ